MQAIQSWNVSTVLAVALMLVAAAMLILGLSMTRRLRGQDRSRQVVEQALATREGRVKAAAAPAAEGAQGRLAAATRATTRSASA